MRLFFDDVDECFKYTSGQKHKSNYVFTAWENKSQNSIKKTKTLLGIPFSLVKCTAGHGIPVLFRFFSM